MQIEPMVVDRPSDSPQKRLSGSGERAHFLALDGVRGLAMTIVFFAHAAINVPEGPWPGFLGRLYFAVGTLCWTGVDLFFVLSGFLITGILLDTKDSSHYFRNFYARRTLRIFPLYYGALAVLFCAGPWILSLTPPGDDHVADSQVWLWLYAVNVGLAVKGQALHFAQWFHANHFWSLAVEEQFYLLWPLVVFFCGPHAIRRVCVGCMLGAIYLRVGLLAFDVNRMALFHLLPCRVDTLAAGAWLAVAIRTGGLAPLVQPARWVAVLGGLALFCMVADAYWTGRWQVYDNNLVKTLGLSVIWAFYGAIIVLVLAARPGSSAQKFFCSIALRWIGKYSYGTYVFHGMFGLFVCSFVTDFMPDVGAFGQSLAYAFLNAGLAVILAVASWHLFEKHWLGLKRFFNPGTEKGAPRRSHQSSHDMTQILQPLARTGRPVQGTMATCSPCGSATSA